MRVSERARDNEERGGVLKQKQSDTLHCQTDRGPGKHQHTKNSEHVDKHNHTHTLAQTNMHVYTAECIHSHMPTGKTDRDKQSSSTWMDPLVNDIQNQEVNLSATWH